MAMLVVATNVLISAVGFALAWQLSRWRRSLVDLTTQLELTERDLAQTLPQATASLANGAAASRLARQRLGQLKSRWQQAQQILTLLGLWRAMGRRSRSR
ncbi:MAG: hypothetical protein WBA10_13210 [Elainellaceae cyanobacterium]